MTLPTEIDQPVECPECGKPMEIGDDGWGECNVFDCDMASSFPPKAIAALRNQLPPNHAAIPNEKLERLRAAITKYDASQPAYTEPAVECGRHLLAHLPAKQPDHVAELRVMLGDNPDMGDRQRAAIELFEKEGKS